MSPPTACPRCSDRISELEDALALALPYVEEAESDPAYKPGVVAKLSKRIQAIVSSEAMASVKDIRGAT